MDPGCLNKDASPIFSSLQMFENFEVHADFMKSREFVKDLALYFSTTINIPPPPKEELRNILKIFFDGRVLNKNFTGFKKMPGKKVFCDTGFCKILIEQTIMAYKTSRVASEDGNKEKENFNEQKDRSAIDELTAKKLIGDIITHSGDWGGKRRSKENCNPNNGQ